MHRQVKTISGRLSLRTPQRRSLEILDHIMEIIQPHNKPELTWGLNVIQGEYPAVTDFEHDFPSFCFSLATGVGKTRLMGAFITYLHLAYGLRNFFVLAPNLTIYNKLVTDFTPNTSKYVFRGIAEFATVQPRIVTGDNYESNMAAATSLLAGHGDEITVNIFNISKINSEVRGGRSPRIKRLSEYIGDSYFNYLAALPDLVLLMDESHRYRASAGARAINELQPILGLELTATPYVETPRGAVPFRNVIYNYPLAMALQDGFIKEPAVVTQRNFQPQYYSREALEQIKLEDGVRVHEKVKVELETYARQSGNKVVKPFMLVIARDTTHAKALINLIQSNGFFDGRYRDKVIQIDSTSQEDEVVSRLLAVEDFEEPTEIVIHVNMLKEGWDVTNLYTIVPLRPANARVLIEQSIGRGLRLPFGKRTGLKEVDRLNIIAHDKFQEIIDEANRPDSIIRLEKVFLEPRDNDYRSVTIPAIPIVASRFGLSLDELVSGEPDETVATLFQSPEERQIAHLTYQAIQRRSSMPSSAHLQHPSMMTQIVQEVQEQYLSPLQTKLPGLELNLPLNFTDIVSQSLEKVRQLTIDIPRIVVTPKGEVTTGFHIFDLDTQMVHYQPVDQNLLIQSLQTNEQEALYTNSRIGPETRLEDYIVRRLSDFPDIAYDDHADLLYEFAGQMIRHLQSYLKDSADVSNVVIYYQRQLAGLIHAQMQMHRWEKVASYEAKVTRGFTPLKESAFTASASKPPQNIHVPPVDKSKIAQLIYSGFQRCLYPLQKFDSDPERQIAQILERETQKWFRPALGQFQIYYQSGLDQREYQPDFVAETQDAIYLLEIKAQRDLENEEVLAKKKAAVTWCQYATLHALEHGGKQWQYVLIPDNAIASNIELTTLVSQFR